VRIEPSVAGNRGEAGGPPHSQFPCFDGIRAIAALMVVLYHAVFFAAWFRTPGGTLFWVLDAGVWIFFVTSGFLLYRPFADAHLNARSSPNVALYALRRAARIYPAYWLVLAFFTFVVARAQIVGVDGFFLNVTLTKTYVHEPNPFVVGLPPAWSLVVEVSFYVFLPIYAAVIALCARRWQPVTVEFSGIVVLSVISVAAMSALANGLDAPWMTVLPQHMLPFALGMLLAIVRTRQWRPQTVATLERWGTMSWLWWSLAALSFVAIPLVFRVEPFDGNLSNTQEIARDLLRTAIGFFVVIPAVLGAQDRGLIRRTLRSRPFVFLGLISYGIYLWHWFLLRIVLEDWLSWPLQKGNWFTLVMLTLPLVIGAATVSFYVLERPILRWAHSVGRRRAPV
jgi:peptidoglycan/LPS O-acetylase OafA/YrhL